MIIPSILYHPTPYTHISQTSGSMYSTGAFGYMASLFTPEKWEKKLKPIPFPDTKKPKPISSQNSQALPPRNSPKKKDHK